MNHAGWGLSAEFRMRLCVEERRSEWCRLWLSYFASTWDPRCLINIRCSIYNSGEARGHGLYRKLFYISSGHSEEALTAGHWAAQANVDTLPVSRDEKHVSRFSCDYSYAHYRFSLALPLRQRKLFPALAVVRLCPFSVHLTKRRLWLFFICTKISGIPEIKV